MKEFYVLFLIGLFFLLMSFQSKPIPKGTDTILGFQRENTVTTWGCWVDGTFTRINVTRGETFKAILQTESLNTLILHGSEKVDSKGNPIHIFGTIEHGETHKAIGTFFAQKMIPISEKYSDNSLMGNIHLIAPETNLVIIFSPNY